MLLCLPCWMEPLFTMFWIWKKYYNDWQFSEWASTGCWLSWENMVHWTNVCKRWRHWIAGVNHVSVRQDNMNRNVKLNKFLARFFRNSVRELNVSSQQHHQVRKQLNQHAMATETNLIHITNSQNGHCIMLSKWSVLQ